MVIDGYSLIGIHSPTSWRILSTSGLRSLLEVMGAVTDWDLDGSRSQGKHDSLGVSCFPKKKSPTSYQMSEAFYGKFPTWIAFKSSEIPSKPTKSSWFNQPDQWWKRQHTFKQELTTGFQSRLSNPLVRRLVTWTCTRTPARRTESWSSHEQLRVLCSKPTWLKIYKQSTLLRAPSLCVRTCQSMSNRSRPVCFFEG